MIAHLFAVSVESLISSWLSYASFCVKLSQTQGLHVVRRQMTSSLLAELVGCMIPLLL